MLHLKVAGKKRDNSLSQNFSCIGQILDIVQSSRYLALESQYEPSPDGKMDNE